MVKPGIFTRFMRNDPNYYYCIICEKKGKEHKSAYSGGSSNMSRHIKASHKTEMAEVMVLKQTQPVNPFVDSSRKRNVGNDEDSHDCAVVEPSAASTSRATSTNQPANSTRANLPSSPSTSTSVTRTQSLNEMIEKISDSEGTYFNIGLLYSL